MNDIVNEFKEKYLDVFDKNGNVKPCGRKACVDLMELANQIRNDDYGNIKTGFLNIENIKKVYSEVK